MCTFVYIYIYIYVCMYVHVLSSRIHAHYLVFAIASPSFIDPHLLPTQYPHLLPTQYPHLLHVIVSNPRACLVSSHLLPPLCQQSKLVRGVFVMVAVRGCDCMAHRRSQGSTRIKTDTMRIILVLLIYPIFSFFLIQFAGYTKGVALVSSHPCLQGVA